MSSLRLQQNRKWRIATFSAVLCLAAWIVWRVTDDEPQYQDRGLWHWYELYHSTNAVEEAAGETAIRSMGTNAVPYLIEILDREPSRLTRWSWQISSRLPTNKAWRKPIYNHEDAAEILAIIGTNAIEAVPSLIRSMQHHDSGAGSDAMANSALAAIGPKALPHVIAALTNSNRDIRGNASRSLIYFFFKDEDTTESFAIFLDTLTSHANPEVRADIARVLEGQIGAYNVLPIVSQKLKTCSTSSSALILELFLHTTKYERSIAIRDLRTLREQVGIEKQALIDNTIQQLLLRNTTNMPSTPP
ncbi:MAG: HEAT repeat domain-containing protein [Verrucomicrobiota bacterium]